MVPLDGVPVNQVLGFFQPELLHHVLSHFDPIYLRLDAAVYFACEPIASDDQLGVRVR